MDIEEKVLEQAEEIAETAAAGGGVEGVGVVEETEEKMLPQSKVNELVGQARREGRDSAMKEIGEKYEIGGEEELGDLIAKGRKYDFLKEEYEAKLREVADVAEENALLKADVSEDRWNDIKLILKGNGYEVTAESIEEMLPTHPEWRKVEEVVAEEPSIKRFGASASAYGKPSIDEKEFVMKDIFKVR